MPDLSKTELSGPGLTRAVAGRPSLVRLKFMDEFGNPTSVTGDFEFGMALVAEKSGEKLANAKPHSKWEGKWLREQDDDFYEIRYEASTAGNMVLHLWCMEACSMTDTKPPCKNRTRKTARCRRSCCKKPGNPDNRVGTTQLGFNRNCHFGVCRIIPGKVNSLCKCGLNL